MDILIINVTNLPAVCMCVIIQFVLLLSLKRMIHRF